jgi:hypothetical protein
VNPVCIKQLDNMCESPCSPCRHVGGPPRSYLGDFLDTPGCLAVQQPGSEFLGSRVYERVGHASKLRELFGVILRVPQASHDAVVLCDISRLPPVVAILQDDKVVDLFRLDQVILDNDIGRREGGKAG